MLWVAPLGIFILSLIPFRDAKGKSTNIAIKTKEIFGPFLFIGPPTQNSIDMTAFRLAKAEVIAKEGVRNTAYYDSEGKLTIGIGHLVLPGDNITYGQTISDAKVNEFFEKDLSVAFEAAKIQALDLNKYTPEFIAALTSVNFQLGTGWPNVFKNTYADLKKGNVSGAISRLQQSKWYGQTPVRVAAFISAIQNAYNA